jgi:cyclic nucleotide gated channel
MFDFVFLLLLHAWFFQCYDFNFFFLSLLLFFMQVLGASWYLLSIDRYTSCWKSQCRKENSPVKCLLAYLDCDTFNDGEHKAWARGTSVFKNCDPDNDIEFKYGIFENAVKKNVVSSNFIEKYLYCLWWGLQQLRYTFAHTIHSEFCISIWFQFHCMIESLYCKIFFQILYGLNYDTRIEYSVYYYLIIWKKWYRYPNANLH